ncbi:MAG: hypothetical protein J6H31_15650 [Butyrivibrio sp.]|nr:hypothetical protein [Butyrivibrio sp.]MBP3819722.1 hypothetical protein [Butyrivibrio sp.]
MKSIKKIGILLFGIILATNVSLTALAADTSGAEEIGKIYEIRPSQEGEFLGQKGNRAKVQVNNEIKKDSRNVTKAKGYTIKVTNTYTLNDYSPLTEYVANRVSKTNLPTVSCNQSAGITVGASVTSTVGVSAEVVNASVGYTVTGSVTMTAGQSYTFPVPYGYKGRIVMRFSQQTSSFDVMDGNKKVGSGSCKGRPKDSYVDLQRVSLW